MRFEKLKRKNKTPNGGELRYGTHLKHVDFALRVFINSCVAGVLDFNTEAARVNISKTYTKAHAHRAHSLSRWGHNCTLGGRGGRRNFGFGRHKLKLFGERGSLPLIKRGSW